VPNVLTTDTRNGNSVPDIAVRAECRSVVARASPPYVGFLLRCYSDPYLADPIRHRRAVEVDAVAGIDRGLAVERQVVGVLGDEHMGEQRRARLATRDRQRRCRGLADGVAALAGKLGADMTNDLEASRDRATSDLAQLTRQHRCPHVRFRGLGVADAKQHKPGTGYRESQLRECGGAAR
jgi:hypothetical protein